MAKRSFSIEWFVLGYKMGLLHELTDLIINNDSSKRNKKLGKAVAYSIARMSVIKTYDLQRARKEVLDLLSEAHLHVVIFNQIPDRGMGRQTKWKELWFEQLEDVQ